MKETIPLKGRIIEESLKLFSVKGYMSTSTTDIIQAADTSKGGFYNHFRSKEQLFLETLSAARKIWREKNLHGVEGAARPWKRSGSSWRTTATGTWQTRTTSRAGASSSTWPSSSPTRRRRWPSR